MDIETIVAYLLFFCPVAAIIGVLIWTIWRKE